MKLEILQDTLRVTEVKELGAANSTAFRDWVRSSLQPAQRHIEIDLSETRFVDSCGLGALVALHKTACNRKGTVRLINPQPSVKQILDLTRMSKVFEIVSPQPVINLGSQPVTTAAVAA